MSPTELEICDHGVIGVDEHGTIAFVERKSRSLKRIRERHPGWSDCGMFMVSGKDDFLFPGFIGMPFSFACAIVSSCGRILGYMISPDTRFDIFSTVFLLLGLEPFMK